MIKFFAFLVLFCTSCAMTNGYLPMHRRSTSMFSAHVDVSHLNDSSFDDSFNTWTIDKVTNNTPNVFEGTLTCTFRVPEHNHPDIVTHYIRLFPYQWKQYYSSTPMKSRFRVNTNCRLRSK